MIKVLVVDDSALMRRVLTAIIGGAADMVVAAARDGAQALAQLHVFQPDVITLDVTMPGMDGLACLDRIMIERPCPVVMLSALTAAGADVTLQALQLGAVDFIAKPAGTVSLAVDELGPLLLDRIRTACGARVRRARRLTERVRAAASGASPARPPARQVFAAAGIALQEHAAGPDEAAAADTIVLVGASTGGPPALDALLAPLPADFPWPIVVAQHMPQAFTGPLARRLDRICALRVTEVTGTVALQAGCAYIARGDADIIFSTRAGAPVVLAAPQHAEHRWHPSVDRMVSSAMKHVSPARLIGVLMTGMGNDGAAAMTRLLREGGRTIAEAEETAVVWGMPGELVRAGGAGVVAPLGRIALHLLEWAR